jgi:hypothetical protein
VAPSAGAAACTPCGVGFTSLPDSTRCATCTPSAFDSAKFKCFSDLSKAGVIIGYISSLLSFLFSVYKARVFVRERVQRLQAAGVNPTLKRIVFVERALANHSKHMMLSLADRAGALGESGPGSDGAAVDTVRDLQRQVSQLQEQQQQQQERQEMQQLMQQQQQQYLEQLRQQQQQQQQHQLEQQQQHSINFSSSSITKRYNNLCVSSDKRYSSSRNNCTACSSSSRAHQGPHPALPAICVTPCVPRKRAR